MWLVVAACTCAFYAVLGAVPATTVEALLRMCGSRSSDGLDFKGVLHSSMVGTGAVAALMLESGLEVVEPARSYACLPPSSWLTWALPAIELGYALHDLLYALRLGSRPFILHGMVASSMLTLCCALGVAHHLSRVLIIHLSTVFLHLRRADFGPHVNGLIDGCFAVSFWCLRLALLPWWWVRFLAHAFRSDPSRRAESLARSRACHPSPHPTKPRAQSLASTPAAWLCNRGFPRM